MRFEAWPQKIFKFLIFFMLISGVSGVYAENPFSEIKDKIKEEINRGKAKFQEELQRAIDRENNNNNEYKSVVPYLIGKTPQEAEYLLFQSHLVLGKVLDQESNHPVGTIISQNYEPNREIPQQTAISVEVAVASPHRSKDAETVVPNLNGMSLKKAKEQIGRVGLALGSIQEKSSDLDGNIVIGQQPKSGTKLRLNSKVDLILSRKKASDNKHRVRLILDKTKIQTNEKFVMTAVVDSSLKAPLEYSFTIEGKVYDSENNQLSHQITKPGKVIVTASVRKKRGKWIHSKSQWLVVEKQKNTEPTKNPPVLVPDISFVLSASNSEIKQYESIDFEGLIQSENFTGELDYRLLIDNQILDSTIPNWTFTFDKSGNYRVVAEAETSDGNIYRSPEIIVRVSRVWDEPRAIISPSSLIVSKGDIATFTSQSTHDENSSVTLFWMDENGGSDTSKSYSINTKNWDEGEYWLSLRVKDDQGFEHTSKAELIITDNLKLLDEEAFVSDNELPQVEAKDIQLSLSASAYHVVADKPIQFTITQHPATQSEYRVVLGDGSERKSEKPWIEHIYSQLGQQIAFVEINYQQERIESKKIKIWVWPSWLLIAIAVIGLLLLLGIFKLFKQRKVRSNETNNSVRYSPTIDSGEQSLETKKTSQGNTNHLTFESEVDEGKQWIAYSKQKKDK